jgi:3-oxoadipate enol-lactonase/4-carboxymuconolactone decarboxylase
MPTIRSNGIELFYDLRGPENAPVVVFSHSIGTSTDMWEPQLRALSSRFRCLAYDTRGHGRSEVRDTPAGMDDLAADLAGLLDGLGIARAHVVGLSLGGMTAQAFAVRYPDRLERLVLMATSAYLPPPEAWDERARAVRADGMGAIVDAVIARWFTPAFVAADPQAVDRVRQGFLATDPRGYAACCAAIRDMDLRSAIGAIGAPTLIVAGADDPSTPPAMAEDMRVRIPGAELVVLPRAAHLLNIERADAVNRHLGAFLTEEAGSGQGSSAFEAGLANRKAVLGAEHVERSLAAAGPFAGPWQDFITRMAWGEIWGDPTLPWKTRSLVTLTIMVALHRQDEFKLHVRPALRNGVTTDELRALLIHTAVYAGVPATNAAFKWVREVLGEELD